MDTGQEMDLQEGVCGWDVGMTTGPLLLFASNIISDQDLVLS